MLKHAGTLIAAAAFMFSLVRSPLRTLALAAVLGGLWWYHSHAQEMHQPSEQATAAFQAAETSAYLLAALTGRDSSGVAMSTHI